MAMIKNTSNTFLLLKLLLPLIVIISWSVVNIEVGEVYFKLIAGTLLLFIVFIALISLTTDKKVDIRKSILERFNKPFEINMVGACAAYILGYIAYAVLAIVFSLVSQQSVTSFMIPLNAEKVNILLQQSAAQLSVTSSVTAEFFNTVVIAPAWEEFMFAFVLYLIIWHVVEGTIKGISALDKPNKLLVDILTLLLVGGMFAFIHQLNGTYVALGMYLFATLFRVLQTSFIVYLAVGIMFALGFHEANNFWWLVVNKGQDFITNALFTPFVTGDIFSMMYSLMFIVPWVIAIVVVFNNPRGFSDTVSNIIKSFKGVF